MPLVNGLLNAEMPVAPVPEIVEQEKLKVEKEQSLRSEVFKAVSSLTETVTEAELKEVLSSLDTNSWDSVVEERFLSGVCGWPLCGHAITVGKLRQFKFDRHQGKVYQNYSAKEKFCSLRCMDFSDFLRPQLSEVPLYLTGERNERSYNIYPSNEDLNAKTKSTATTANASSKSKDSERQVEFVPDKLIAQMKNLFIAENAESGSDSEGNDDEDDDGKKKKKRDPEDVKFLNEVRSFVTAKTATSLSTDPGICKTPNPKPAKKPIGPTPEEAEAKLAKLREKYGKGRNEKTKKPPLIVEPHNEASLKPKTPQRDAKKHAEAAIDLLSAWITPSTVNFLATDQHPRKPIENELLYEQFIASILDPRHATKIYDREQETDAVKLPLVDKVDQHFRRVDIVMNAVKNPWTAYISRLKIAANFTQCKNLIATFNLTRDNIVVEPKIADVLAIALFHLITHNNAELRALAEQDEAVQKHKAVMESFQLEVDFFSNRLKAIIEKISATEDDADVAEKEEAKSEEMNTSEA
uniref:RNA polymerase II subunit B1 CTD phosphatase RPAP2 homolog n=1 Tax=Panagrellus redivivus TaxID=6233 RepID=A0A7E5A0X7_PANRE